MIKKYCLQALELTKYIIEKYWQGEQWPLIQYISPDILWIGSTNSEYIHGSEEMIARLKKNKAAMPPVFLDEQEYEIVDNQAASCLIVGRYRAFTKQESGMLLSEKQRITFYWVKVSENGKEFLKIKHIHLSNVLKMQDEEEFFPTKFGKENYDMMRNLMAERSLGEVITVKDTDKVVRIINYSQIMYIEADRNYINISISKKNNKIRTRMNLSAVSKLLPTYFVELGRSSIVNKYYVREMKDREINMVDGKVFHIPRQSMVVIRNKINEDI